MTLPPDPAKHGGARVGSGVKSSDGAHGLRPVTVSLDAATIAGAQALGGSVSVGLRRAVAIALAAAAKK